MAILEYWSHPTSPPRKNQVTALEWAEQQDARYLIIEAPVGCGKSHIGMTLSRALAPKLGNSFILTPQRILQEQYEKSFDSNELATLYGKSNYTCAPKRTTCDVGSVVKPACAGCPQVAAREWAKTSPNVVFNYSIALLHFAYLPTFIPRKLMILDECHTLESYLTEFDAISVSERRALKFGAQWKHLVTLKAARDWMFNEYMPKMEAYLQDLKDQCEPFINEETNMSRREEKLIREYNSTREHRYAIKKILDDTTLEEMQQSFVLAHDPASMKFKRLSAATSFNNIVDHKAERFLFMSSTILNPTGFCRDLGIDPKEAAFLSLASEFPVENRPVYYSPVTKMNAKWSKDQDGKAKMLSKIREIADMHKDESGIIHTGNFAIAIWLAKELNLDTHRIMHHNPGSGDDRNKVINAFTESNKPVILISPSITEGLDLVEDRARFAIFAKIPFGYLGDQWIKARMEQSQEWYQRQALIQVIQGGGRIVRSEKDWGNVYILDQSWDYLFFQTRNTIPQWWKDGYKRLK